MNCTLERVSIFTLRNTMKYGMAELPKQLALRQRAFAEIVQYCKHSVHRDQMLAHPGKARLVLPRAQLQELHACVAQY